MSATDMHTLRIEGAIVRGAKRKSKLRRPKFHCGDVGMCERKAIIHTLVHSSYEITEDITTTLYFRVGTAVHEVVSEQLRNAGLLKLSELRLEEPRIGPPKLMPLKGYVDNVIKVGDELGVIEVKTCGDLPLKPKGWHPEQLGMYMLLTGIPNGYLLYMSRKVADFKGPLMRVFKVDSSVIQKAALTSARASVFVNAGVLPPKPAHLKTQSACGFCPFTSFCWKDRPLPLDAGVNFKPDEELLQKLGKKAVALSHRMISDMPRKLAEVESGITSGAHIEGRK